MWWRQAQTGDSDRLVHDARTAITSVILKGTNPREKHYPEMSHLPLYVFQLTIAQNNEALSSLLPSSLQGLTQALSPSFTSEEAKALP